MRFRCWSSVVVVVALAAAPRAQDAAAWWSLRPLAPVTVPRHPDGATSSPIDAFVQRRLALAGLRPSAEADRRTLIRRLTFDLHGLPPTPAEVRSFVADERPDAYRRLVDRLLDSERYGERWARHWLDVVHYGETHGFDKDKLRAHAWPYRDWVIRAFNADKPYARFVREQLAGDVLWPDSADGVVATGFIAAGPWDFVGHVELREGTRDKHITRSLDRDDMVTATMQTFASTTVHCARCHDHRFDPIPTRDYYRLQAVFAGIERAERPYPDPERDAAVARLEAERRELERDAARLEAELAASSTPKLRMYDAEIAALSRPVDPTVPVVPDSSQLTNVHGWHSQIASRPEVEKWVEVDFGVPRRIEWLALFPSHDTFHHAGPGFGFPLEFRVEGVGTDGQMRRIAEYRRGEPWDSDDPWVCELDGTPLRSIRVTAERLRERKADWIFALAELTAWVGSENVARGSDVRSADSIEAPERWARTNLTDGRLGRGRLDDLAPPQEWLAASHESASRRERLLRWRTERRETAIASLPVASRARIRRGLPAALESNRRARAELPPSPRVYAAAREFEKQGSFTPPAAPREIAVLHRGDIDQPGEVVAAGALSTLRALEHHFVDLHPEDEGARRVALAGWLVDPENPLAWRSIVNRVWQYHFGRGLVDTPNDFGRMGQQPSHPELLDWLAVRFRDGGGSFKELHRLILNSATWRQAVSHRPEAARVDGSNRLLWRQNRRRLEAEAVRDSVLAVSGDLDLTMGGPSDRQFYFRDDHSPEYDYRRFDVTSVAGRRRSIYRHIVRSVPDPFLECLDAPDSSLLTAVRYSTLTAQQALSLSNHPFMVWQAERFAARARGDAEQIGEQVERAHWLALGREPSADERQALVAHARRHGFASACRVLLNTNEFLFID